MKNNRKRNSNGIENTLWNNLIHRRWMRAVIAMASVVVFVTVYALILPAAAETQEQAVIDNLIQDENADNSVVAEAPAQAEEAAPQDSADGGNADANASGWEATQTFEDPAPAADVDASNIEATETAQEETPVTENTESQPAEEVPADAAPAAETTEPAAETTVETAPATEPAAPAAETTDSAEAAPATEQTTDAAATTETATGAAAETTTPAAEGEESVTLEEQSAEDAEATEEEEKETEPEEIVYLAGELSWGDDTTDYKVTVSYDEAAQIPENAELRVNSITKEISVDEYTEVAYNRFLTLSIYKDGKDIIPAAKVNVAVEYKDVPAGDRINYVVSGGELVKVDSYSVVTPATVGTVVTREKKVYESGTLVYEGEDFKVVLAYNDESGIPKGSRMEVTEIKQEVTSTDGLGYDDYLNKANEKLDEQDRTVKFARFFDIKLFDRKGIEYEPTGPVKVNISQNKSVAEEQKKENDVKEGTTTEKTVLHFTTDENTQKTETNEMPDVSEEEITPKAGTLETIGNALGINKNTDDGEEKDNYTFETDSFSVYGILECTGVTFEITNPNGEIYEVTVTFGKDANIPEGSTLSVTPFEKGSEGYEKALKVYLASQGDDADVSGFAALDISIIDPNGNEIEPDDTVTVDMKIKSLPDVENLEEVMDTMAIHHHVEKEDGSIEVEKVQFQDNYDSTGLTANFKTYDDGENTSTVTSQDIADIHLGGEELNVEFDTEVFSTFTITWRGGLYNPARTITVHYVDESGNELTIANPDNTHPNMTMQSSSPAFLIYDIDGYEYSYTYRNTNTNANRIRPILQKNNNNYWRYTTSTGDNVSWTEFNNGDNVYVVYRKKADPTTGGTPVIEDLDPEDWPQSPATPQFYKSSTNNGNGSNTVSLSISGGEKEYTQSTKANVIVVFDRSGSMGGDNIWRLNTAKAAVNEMANTLLNGSIEGVKMALVSFSTTASTVQEFTDSYNDYTRAVNNLNASGGTNWEQALSIANRMAVDSDAATFVVFVTDGDPTFRVSRGDVTNGNLDMYNSTTYTYYRNNYVFGQGNNDSYGRNFDYAAEEVKSILANNKNFYAIGVSSDVTKVQNLVDEAGGGTAYLATDEEALEEAFKNITQSIKTTLGFGDVQITDGITELANVEMKVMQEVDPDSFTYYKVTSSGQAEWDPASEGAGLASYDSATGSVTWNMGEGFQLEDGVTYMVTFKAWPSQDAYDLVAQLNNGEKVYATGQPNSITDEERSQIVELSAPTETTQGNYTLKTNTDSVKATYSQTSSTGETVTVSGDTDITADYHEGTMENMGLTSQLLTIKKIFDQSLDPRTVDSVTLKLQRMVNDDEHSMEDFNAPGTDSPEIVLGNDNNWEYSFYVAPGFIIDGETLETGYKFTVTEPDLGEHTVRYDLIPEIVNPMVVDGELQLIGDGDDNQALTAINRTRSAIEIHKTLYDVDGTEIYPDTEFTITGHLLGPDGQPFTSQETAAPVAYYMYDKDGNTTTGRMHFPTTADISFTLKPGEFIRFVNVLEGCTFVFQEASMPDNYELDSLAALGRQRAENDPAYTYSIELTDAEAHLVEGTETISTTEEGIIGNTNYKLDFYNKRVIPLPDIELIKVDQDDNTKKLNDAAFVLHKDSPTGEMVNVDGNGKEIHIVTDNKEGSAGPDGWYHIGVLPAGTYYMVETTEPEGYLHDETPVIITVTQNGNSYDVTATKDGVNILSGPTEGLYTITVDNKKATKYIRVFKYETGTNPEKALEGAEFSLVGPEGTEVDYSGKASNDDGYVEFEEDGTTIIELPVNDSPYTLTETNPPAGYKAIAGAMSFTVTADGVSATASGYEVVSDKESIGGIEVTVYTIKVQNSAGTELPNTGGSGTLLYTLTGLILITGSMLGFTMRRRERRYN